MNINAWVAMFILIANGFISQGWRYDPFSNTWVKPGETVVGLQGGRGNVGTEGNPARR